MREKIRLNSSAGTGHFYTTDKNKRTMPEKMEVKKYDPVVRKHVAYKEGKIKQSLFAPKKTRLACGFFIAHEKGDKDKKAKKNEMPTLE